MTKPRMIHCDNPNCPHEKEKWISDWVRVNLRDSYTGLWVTDLDFFLLDDKIKKCMLLETKTNNADLPHFQQDTFALLNKWIRQGKDPDWNYLGFHKLKLEHYTLDDGRIWLDNKISTKEEVKAFLDKI